jgi:hypothetical protein
MAASLEHAAPTAQTELTTSVDGVVLASDADAGVLGA